jgi:aspartyl-tRNA(Asn)/glutamyl-tRNA(Gln) amidotransferase subunit B
LAAIGGGVGRWRSTEYFPGLHRQGRVWDHGRNRRGSGRIVEQRGLKQVTDTGAIEAAVDEVIAANPKQVEQVKAKPQTLGWFVGQVMKATGGKANPAAVNDILKKKLWG